MSLADSQADIVESAKANLRRAAHTRRAELGDAYRKEAAQRAARHFFEGMEIEAGKTIACYWPIRDELDCRPILTRLMDDGWRVCLPVVGAADDPLVFRVWEVGQPLNPAGFGTLEPVDGAPVANPDVIIMPLLGFDRHGTRLGYGGGYYDRTLATLATRPMLIGYAFAAQEQPEVPHLPHDVPLDMLVTENGVVRFGKTA